MEVQEVTRGSGILLAVSSLPSPYGIGTLGDAARQFVDLLVDLKQKYWQILPVGPTSYGDSPYQTMSAFAGSPYLIDLDELIEDGLLTKDEISCYNWGLDESTIDYATLFDNRFRVLHQAFERFDESDSGYQQFLKENADWIEDYGLFMALKETNGNERWQNWPEEIKKKNNRLRLQNAEKHCIITSGFGRFANTSSLNSGQGLGNMPIQKAYS